MSDKVYKDNAQARHSLRKRDWAVRNDLCVTCHEPESVTGSRKGKTKCDACHEAYQSYANLRKEKFLSTGMCGSCGVNPCAEGKKKCVDCLARHQK